MPQVAIHLHSCTVVEHVKESKFHDIVMWKNQEIMQDNAKVELKTVLHQTVLINM